MNNNFKFSVPCDINKAKNEKGEEVYKFKGKASSRKQDSQGETLDPETFDISEFKVINWNHQSSKDASAYVGEPTKVEIKNGEMFIEGELFPEMDMTKHIVALMKALKKRGKNLCLSIEGKVVERGSEDKNSPLYKIIKRAKITGCAITPNPINSDTFCELIEKGFVSDWMEDEEALDIVKSYISKSLNENLNGGVADNISIEDIAEKHNVDLSYAKKMLSQGISVEKEHTDSEDVASEIALDHLFEDIEYYTKLEKIESKNKAIDTGTTGIIGKESVEHEGEKRKILKKITKSELYNKIFSYFYDINIVKAKKIGELCEKISEMENTPITDETINKAFEILGKADSIVKSEQKEENLEEKEEMYKGYSKSSLEKACKMYKGMSGEEMKKAMMQDGYNEKFVDVTCDYSNPKSQGGDKEISKSDIQEILTKSLGGIEELVKGSSEQVALRFSAMADIFKSQEEKIYSLTKSLEGVTSFNEELRDRLNRVESQPNLRKSVQTERFVERFAKSEDGKEIYSLNDSKSRKELIDRVTDLSGINKGDGKFDMELANIAQDIEIAKSVSPRQLQKLNSLNIQVQA